MGLFWERPDPKGYAGHDDLSPYQIDVFSNYNINFPSGILNYAFAGSGIIEPTNFVNSSGNLKDLWSIYGVDLDT